MSDHIRAAVYELPQASFLTESRIDRFITNAMKQGEDRALWLVRRLGAIGGSEIGAFLREHYGVFYDAPGASFKDAKDIIAEKMMVKSGFTTPQAERGIAIEAFTKAVFCKKYKLETDETLMDACRIHASLKGMAGNADDAFRKSGKKILVDYKSSQHSYDEVPFDYQAQVNQYGAIARSNDVEFDKALIVGIHAPEPVLQKIAKITDERHANPEAFNFWVDTMATKGILSVELKTYPVSLDDKFMKVIESTSSYYFENYLAKGKLISVEKNVTLPETVQQNTDQLMGESVQLMAVIEAANSKLAANNKLLNETMRGVETKKLKFTDKHCIDIAVRSNFNRDAAIESLRDAGVDVDGKRTPGKKIDFRKLSEAFVALGGDINSKDLLEEVMTTDNVRALLKTNEISEDLFESKKLSFGASRKKSKKEMFAQEVGIWASSLDEAAQAASIMRDANQFTEDEAEQVESPSEAMTQM